MLHLSKHNITQFGKVPDAEFVAEAFRAVIANGQFGINDAGQCVYRTEDNEAACGIGVCLTDEQVAELDASFETSHYSNWISGASVQGITPALGIPHSTDIDVLRHMQVVHDNAANHMTNQYSKRPMLESLIGHANRISFITPAITEGLAILEKEAASS